LEEIMKKQITISVAALAFGAVLASAPAFAQQAANSGRNLNDGGIVNAPAAKPLYNTVQQQKPSTPNYGRNLDDGGMVPDPTPGIVAAEKAQDKANQQKSAPHYGRAPNDGGM
jgi:hypothetical protein